MRVVDTLCIVKDPDSDVPWLPYVQCLSSAHANITTLYIDFGTDITDDFGGAFSLSLTRWVQTAPVLTFRHFPPLFWTYWKNWEEPFAVVDLDISFSPGLDGGEKNEIRPRTIHGLVGFLSKAPKLRRLKLHLHQSADFCRMKRLLGWRAFQDTVWSLLSAEVCSRVRFLAMDAAPWPPFLAKFSSLDEFEVIEEEFGFERAHAIVFEDGRIPLGDALDTPDLRKMELDLDNLSELAAQIRTTPRPTVRWLRTTILFNGLVWQSTDRKIFVQDLATVHGYTTDLLNAPWDLLRLFLLHIWKYGEMECTRAILTIKKAAKLFFRITRYFQSDEPESIVGQLDWVCAHVGEKDASECVFDVWKGALALYDEFAERAAKLFGSNDNVWAFPVSLLRCLPTLMWRIAPETRPRLVSYSVLFAFCASARLLPIPSVTQNTLLDISRLQANESLCRDLLRNLTDEEMTLFESIGFPQESAALRSSAVAQDDSVSGASADDDDDDNGDAELSE